ncbi:MAG: hypothetical protein IT299_06240 [Dehalococcoidia bacterium]|nr:hypothetical protein [Dehalococcoidia bacterium]
MVRIEMTDASGQVYPVLISSGVELAPQTDESGVDVIDILDAGGRTVTRVRWDAVLSAAVERNARVHS